MASLMSLVMEGYEFGKWAHNRFFVQLFEDPSYYDNYIVDVIGNELNPLLDQLRVLNSCEFITNFATLKNEHKEYEEILSSTLESLLKSSFENGNYDAFPMYVFCSWKLNKKFREIHDKVSYYLGNIDQ